jgi:iron complex outermembrane receptor protein
MTKSTQMNNRSRLHYRLLATVSATVLLATGAHRAVAAESDHSMVWIEFGGAFDQLTGDDERWLPPNLTPPISKPPLGPFGAMPIVGWDAEAKISFEPADSNWIFSAGVQYGRARSKPKRSHDQSYHVTGYITSFGSKPGSPKYILTNYDFSDAARSSLSTHTILDFQAGKDVGLGMLKGSSVLSAGVRVAKLNEGAEGQFTGFLSAPGKYSPGEVAHVASFHAKHSFTGIGPSVSWDASAPFVGNLTEGFSFDWGINAALLFGSQKAKLSLKTRDTQYYPPSYHATGPGIKNQLSHSSENPDRSKNVMVPNVGGFAGISWRLPNAKVSLGYRADMFFNAIDGGVAARKIENRGFYGPFASISIGLGD